MKIALVGGDPVYMLRFRGHLLNTLCRAGHQVVALAGATNADVEHSLHALGVRFVPLPLDRSGTNPIAELRTLRALIQSLRRERPDYVIASSPKLISYSGIAARLLGIGRSAALVTGLGVAFWDVRSLRALLVHRTARVLLKLGLEHSSVVIFQNPDDQAMLERLRLVHSGQRIARVEGSGVDLKYFGASEISTEPFTFLFMGRMIESKGVSDFIAAAREVKAHAPQVRFQLLGPSDEGHPHALSRTELDRDEREIGIEHLGNQSDVRPYLKGATVLVVPSRGREGMPRSILEAFAMARPVITTNIPGCRHAVEHERTGLIVPEKDPQALARAMLQLINAPDQVRRMSLHCRGAAEQRFDVEKVTHNIIRALDIE